MDNNQDYQTTQMSNLGVNASGNPLQMRGLMNVLKSSYHEGITLEELQVAVGTAIQQQLQQSLQGIDQASAQTVLSFLQGLDYTLTQDYNKTVRSDRTL